MTDNNIESTVKILKHVFEMEKIETEMSDYLRMNQLEYTIDEMRLFDGDPSVIACELKRQNAAFLLSHFRLFDVVGTERVEKWM
ncbi:hypothetical protein FHE72_20430 [Rossellomorea vietnamensis]|uniref:Uncharacterized protein n=1 Tax=Rossellomorea vietnamensis TaxID=218284 RepID=A0A6I6UMB3_9BACI|nr:hypothetical protein [Rossellomorea vietnamensis]QHE63108.1 hypothetical protein FHE72_20430 [Rossellomorea vietnamensis]